MHFTRCTTADFHVSYARSAARSDLNSLTNYFDAVLWPVVGENAYAPAATDAPNRLLSRGRLMPTPRWLMLGIFDWRSGLPVWNALNSFLPTDVQANLGSPAFGSFYSSEPRQYRIQVRFER